MQKAIFSSQEKSKSKLKLLDSKSWKRILRLKRLKRNLKLFKKKKEITYPEIKKI
jgi:hypothetical protein